MNSCDDGVNLLRYLDNELSGRELEAFCAHLQNCLTCKVRLEEERTHRQESQVELSHREFRPDFNVSYTYDHTADQLRDYYPGSFGIRLPNHRRQSAPLAEATQNEET